MISLFAAPVAADVIFSTQGTLPPPRENVQFNDDDLILAGSTIQGITNQTGTIIEFLGDEPLYAAASGQARIKSDDGGFSLLTIDPLGSQSFTGLGFNLDATEDGEVTITANRRGATAVSQTFDLSRNGQNRFNLQATEGDLLESVTIESSVDLADVLQVRIAIPEPASAALLASAGLLLLRRR